MKILVYEYFTARGPTAPGATRDEALAAAGEGSAMLRAVAGDLAELPGVEVLVPARGEVALSTRPGWRTLAWNPPADDVAELARLAGECAWTLVIAPEWQGLLAARVGAVAAAGARLLGPSAEAVRVAADKQLTAVRLAGAGVSVPPGEPLAVGERPRSDFGWPAVRKPRDGAGSRGVRLICSVHDTAARHPAGEPERLERFCRGLPASVAVLAGPDAIRPLVPCRQHLAPDGQFRYLGGSLPLRSEFTERACQLAQRAVAALPGALGYLGVDLVLGDDPGGREDYVIEINPRLTTSYLGLRAACRGNLAAAMLDVASGQTPELAFDRTPREFGGEPGGPRGARPEVLAALSSAPRTQP